MDTLVFESYQIQNLELFTAMHKYINENIIELEDNVSTFNVMLEAKKVKWWEAVKAWFKQIFTLIGKLFAAIFLGKKYKITEISKDSQKAVEQLKKEQEESGQIVLTAEQQNQLLQNQIKKQQILTQIGQKALPAPSVSKADQQKNLINTEFNNYIAEIQKLYNGKIANYQKIKSSGKTPNIYDKNMPVQRDVQIGIQGFSQDGKSGWAAYCKKMIESLTKYPNVIPEVELQIESIETEILHSLKILQFSIEKSVTALFLLRAEINLVGKNSAVNITDLKNVPDKIFDYHLKNFIEEVNNFYKKMFKLYTNIWTAILILDPLNTSSLKPLKLDKCEPILDNFRKTIDDNFNDFKTNYTAANINKIYGGSSNAIASGIKHIYSNMADPAVDIAAKTDAGFKKIQQSSEADFYKCELSSATNNKSVKSDADVFFISLTKLKDSNKAFTGTTTDLIPDLKLTQFTNYIQMSLKNIVDFEMLLMKLLEYCKALLTEPIICQP